MASLPQVTFEPSKWCRSARDWLHALGEADGSGNYIQERVEAGDWQLLLLSCDGVTVGACTYSIERDTKGTVLVVNYLAGHCPQADLTEATFEFFDLMQRVMLVDAVRFWTARTGLKRKLEGRDFKTKYVMERRL